MAASGASLTSRSVSISSTVCNRPRHRSLMKTKFCKLQQPYVIITSYHSEGIHFSSYLVRKSITRWPSLLARFKQGTASVLSLSRVDSLSMNLFCPPGCPHSFSLAHATLDLTPLYTGHPLHCTTSTTRILWETLSKHLLRIAATLPV